MMARRLTGIEVLRGVAASIVVVFHVVRHLNQAAPLPFALALTRGGHAGVDLFFVISGFIILHVHRADIGLPRRLSRYATRRASRILPLYWIGLTVTLVMAALGHHGLPAVQTIAWQAALLPEPDPILGVSWTLQFEALFYVAFGLLIVRRDVGLAVMGMWGLAMAAGVAGLRIAGPLGIVQSLHGVEFGLGMAAAAGSRHVVRGGWVAGWGAVLFVAALTAEGLGRMPGGDAAGRLAYGVPSALMVAGVAAMEANPFRSPALVALGGASYSIYLFQFVFIGVAWQGLTRSGASEWLGGAALFKTAAAILGGYVVSRLVERPLLRVMQGWTAARAGAVRRVPS